jgi:hypothetical protein
VVNVPEETAYEKTVLGLDGPQAWRLVDAGGGDRRIEPARR